MIRVVNDWTWVSKHVDESLQDETLYEAVHMYMQKYNISIGRMKELYHDAVDCGMTDDGKYLSFSEWFHAFAYDDIAEIKEERIKEIFYKCYSGDTDWSLAADMFVSWCVDRDFETQSFKEFVEWLDDSEIGKLWHFFFGYSSDFEKFADDWIEDEERDDYLKYCLSQQ